MRSFNIPPPSPPAPLLHNIPSSPLHVNISLQPLIWARHFSIIKLTLLIWWNPMRAFCRRRHTPLLLHHVGALNSTIWSVSRFRRAQFHNAEGVIRQWGRYFEYILSFSEVDAKTGRRFTDARVNFSSRAFQHTEGQSHLHTMRYPAIS